MGSGRQIPLWKRHAIITLRLLLEMKAKEIAEKLNLPLKSVETLILRVRRRSCSRDLDDLMDAAAIQPKSGAPQRVPPGSTLSHVMRAGVQEFEVQPM